MNRDEYEQYQRGAAHGPEISVDDVGDNPRTLAYGYTVDGDTWHAFVGWDGLLHVVVYNGFRNGSHTVIAHEEGASLPVDWLRPNKRVYPDTVDLRFAELMRDALASLIFRGYFDWDGPDVAVRAAKVEQTGFAGYTG